ncbi:OmpA family protein [bacterium]|nr:OmpA family protein [bacterium]
MFRFILGGIFVFFAVFVHNGRLNAQYAGFSTTVEGGRGLMYMQSAETYGKGKLVIGMKTLVMEKESNVANPDGRTFRLRKDYPSIAALPISFGMTDEIDLNVSFYGFHDTRTLVSQEDVRLGYGDPQTGFGSTRIGAKIRLPLKREFPLQIAGKFGAMLDTSQEEADGMNYRWSRMGTDIEASLYETLRIFSFMSLSLEEGYIVSGSDVYDDKVVGALGLNVRFKDRCSLNLELNNRTFLGVGPLSTYQALEKPWLFETVNGVPGIGNPALLKDDKADFMEDFFIFSPSIALRLTKHIAIDFGVNYNLADQVEPKEKLQAVVGITFNTVIRSLIDSDRDGINDKADKEPYTPKGFPVDSRGIAIDTDVDGVPDGKDLEPDTPLGAKTDANGVGIDTDGDGIYDGIDMEPDTPAGSPVDKFGVALDDDRDGVPNILDEEPQTPIGAVVDETGKAIDSDEDGIPDGIDMEPSTPKGALVDKFGVGIDTDEDGVPNGIDEEPNTEKGILVDKRGRGLIKHEVDLLREGLIHLTTVQFNPGTAVLNPESYPALNEIGQILIKYNTLTIQIEGHTDNTGDIKTNLKLSRDRAYAVKDYLLENFPMIDQKRLRAVGFGSDKPIAPNSTIEGRNANRRVDFIIINRDELIKK